MRTPIPEDWKETLTALQVGGFPEAVIAGGALRDLSQHVSIKDVDIFVRDHGEFTDILAAVADALGMSQWSLSWLVDPNMAEYFTDRPDIYGVIDAHGLPGDVPIQVIVLKEDLFYEYKSASSFGKAVVTRVDFGMSQIFYDGTATHMTPVFTSDIENRTFTLTQCSSAKDFRRSCVRFKRFRERYPDWTMRVPPDFEETAKKALLEDAAMGVLMFHHLKKDDFHA